MDDKKGKLIRNQASCPPLPRVPGTNKRTVNLHIMACSGGKGSDLRFAHTIAWANEHRRQCDTMCTKSHLRRLSLRAEPNGSNAWFRGIPRHAIIHSLRAGGERANPAYIVWYSLTFYVACRSQFQVSLTALQLLGCGRSTLQYQSWPHFNRRRHIRGNLQQVYLHKLRLLLLAPLLLMASRLRLIAGTTILPLARIMPFLRLPLVLAS